MKNNKASKLPQIPNKRYFTIGEVGHLCSVKPHVLRYWEQEFPQLRPAKRRGNRRYYQREEVMMVRNIRGLLYDEGYTISGARIQLDQVLKLQRAANRAQKNINPNLVLSAQTVSDNSSEPLEQQDSEVNGISYSVSFTVDDTEQTDSVENNQPVDSSTHQEHVEPEKTQSFIPNDSIANPNHDNTSHKLKAYKITLSEVIVELKDILAEIQEDTQAQV